jgi:hypothetical protein
MGLAATERTAKIIAILVAGIGKKKYPAMPASPKKCAKAGMLLKHRTKRPIILRNYPSNFFLPMPVRNKFIKCLNLNYKKAISLLNRLISLAIPSLSFPVIRKL